MRAVSQELYLTLFHLISITLFNQPLVIQNLQNRSLDSLDLVAKFIVTWLFWCLSNILDDRQYNRRKIRLNFFTLKNMEQGINFAAFVVMLLVLEELHCKCFISIKETQQTVWRIKIIYIFFQKKSKILYVIATV